MSEKKQIKPKERSPYDHLLQALHAVSAVRLAVIDGPNPPKQENGSELEFWHVRGGDPQPGRMIIIQRWTGHHPGGFDVYLQQREHRTAHSIAEIVGRPITELVDDLDHEHVRHVGRCPVCGHYGDDCTGKAS